MGELLVIIFIRRVKSNLEVMCIVLENLVMMINKIIKRTKKRKTIVCCFKVK
jgi:hypothetical protein